MIRVDLAPSNPSRSNNWDDFPAEKWDKPRAEACKIQPFSHTRILDRETYPIGLAARATMGLPTGETNAWMSHEGVTGGLELLVDGQYGPWHTGARLGYTVIPAEQIFDLHQDDHLTFAISATWQPTNLPWRTSVEWNIATCAAAPFVSSAELYGELRGNGLRYFRRT